MEKLGKTCKGDSIMKIAVTYENGQIFQHFGHTEQFKLYEAADGKITHAEVVDTNGSLCRRRRNISSCGGRIS